MASVVSLGLFSNATKYFSLVIRMLNPEECVILRCNDVKEYVGSVVSIGLYFLLPQSRSFW